MKQPQYHLFVFVLVTLMGLTACWGSEAADEGEPVKVVTFNIWHNQQDWPRRRDGIVAGLRAMKPDVVCLQEVLQNVDLSNQAQTLAESMGYHYTFASVDTVGSVKRYGNAILSRHPLLAEHGHRLLPQNDYRVVAHARIAMGKQALDVYCTHLHHKSDSSGENVRSIQLSDLLDFVDSTATGASILAGDFNARPDAPEMEVLRPRFRDAYAATHPDLQGEGPTTLNPHAGHAPRRIDYVFYDTRSVLRPVEAEVIFNEAGADSVWASDHFGMLVRLEWEPEVSN